MQNELLDNRPQVEPVQTPGAAPNRQPVFWVSVALTGLLVAGIILVSSWFFRG